MARIQWHGSNFIAQPIEQLPNGDWRMTALEHGARFTIGTVIIVQQSEILSMDAAEMPDPAASAGALEKAMADERKALPSVREVMLANAKKAAEQSA
jgi:hypothetical protein